jgi:hypothetical protein
MGKFKFTLFLLLIGSSSCEKMPFDYRNVYVGDYDFTINTPVYVPYSGIVFERTYFQGKVSYGGTSNSILIHYSNDKTKDLDVVISKDGKIRSSSSYSRIDKNGLFYEEVLGMAGQLSKTIVGKKK